MRKVDPTMAEQVAEAISVFQERRTGYPPKAVTVVLSDDTLVVTLHEALSPAEKALASTPQGQPDLFPEASSNSRAYGYNRAKTAWYTIDPLFYDRNNNLRPPNVSRDELSLHSVREVRRGVRD